MNKRNKKISKVMREYKAGTLKSGGSGKKVTNPKQAMAIALSEARNMNQGGMLNTIYQRPMFQTPQTRQGSGIMAGVAPVRLQDGGDPGFMSRLGDLIVGDDGTMSDFFTMDKTEEGSGLNARDLTDFFVVDPDDPTDVAIATATAGLLAGGITAPAALVAKLGQMGYKGKKVIDTVRKAVEAGQSGTLKGLEATRQTARMLPEAGELAIEEGLPRVAGGIADLVSTPAMASGLDEEVEEESSFTDYIPSMDTMLGAGAAGIAGLVGLKSPKAREALGKAAGAVARNPIKSTAGGVGALTVAGTASPLFSSDDPEPEIPTTPASDPVIPQSNPQANANAEVKDEVDTGVETEEEQGLFANIMERLGDPRVQAGLANAARPTEGWTKRNFFSDFNEGARNYDLEQARIDSLTGGGETDFITNFEFLQEKFPEQSNEDLTKMALSLSKRSSNNTLLNTLFRSIKENEDLTTEEALAKAQAMLSGGGYTPSASVDGITLSAEEAEAIGP
jgi:hypothetical protein